MLRTSLSLRRGENQILAALSEEAFKLALPALELIDLELREPLYTPGGRIKFVYFPLSAMLSLVTVMRNGAKVEAATIGNEGSTGSPLSIPGTVSPLLMICQVPGEALRMPATAFRRWLRDSEAVRDVMDRHAQALLALVAQTAACTRLHSVEQRCGGWLLLAHDRARSDEFPMTHKLIGAMLGVRRASVSVAASSFQRLGYISYRHGQMTVIAREGLEGLTCECYEAALQHQLRSMRGR